MPRIVILYPRTPGAEFNLDYYLRSHLALVRSSLGDAVTGISVHRGIAGPGGVPAAFLISTAIDFRDMKSLQSGIERHGAKIAQDVANFTTIAPTLQIEEEAVI